MGLLLKGVNSMGGHSSKKAEKAQKAALAEEKAQELRLQEEERKKNLAIQKQRLSARRAQVSAGVAIPASDTIGG
jgi:methylase of polypeptide subunit release factors